jgi:hypothetical protein
MKRTIEGFVYYIKYDFCDTPHLAWNASPDMGKHDPDWVLVGPHSFEVECPDDFDPRPQQVAALDKEIEKTRAKMHARITELQEQKNRLLALEMTP